MLVSTDVSSRGIDVPETEVVINLRAQMSDDYVHRWPNCRATVRASPTLVDPTDMVALERVRAIAQRRQASGRISRCRSK